WYVCSHRPALLLPCLFTTALPSDIYTLSLHDALPIFFDFLRDVLTQVSEIFPAPYVHIGGDECPQAEWKRSLVAPDMDIGGGERSEEHTSELQSRFDLVCRLLLEKKRSSCTWCRTCVS